MLADRSGVPEGLVDVGDVFVFVLFDADNDRNIVGALHARIRRVAVGRPRLRGLGRLGEGGGVQIRLAAPRSTAAALRGAPTANRMRPLPLRSPISAMDKPKLLPARAGGVAEVWGTSPPLPLKK